jgi:ABC-2 type transport system permease protein
MRLVVVHARLATLELLRYPSFIVPTLAFPPLFFVLFALPRASGRAGVLVASFAAYAVLSVAFFQFGVGIAVERTRSWELYLRTLPVGAATRLGGRALSALCFATASLTVLLAVAVPTAKPALAAAELGRLTLALAAGALPFTALGIALGYLLPAKAALPAANVAYLGLAYAGGLWTGPTGLPGGVERAGAWLPTRQWAELLWAATTGRPWTVAPCLALAGYAAGFAALAAWAYRRDEGRRFS